MQTSGYQPQVATQIRVAGKVWRRVDRGFCGKLNDYEKKKLSLDSNRTIKFCFLHVFCLFDIVPKNVGFDKVTLKM